MNDNHLVLAPRSSKISSSSILKHLKDSMTSGSSSASSSMRPQSFFAQIWLVFFSTHFQESCGVPWPPCRFLRVSSKTSRLSADYWYCSTIVLRSWKVESMLSGIRFSVRFTSE